MKSPKYSGRPKKPKLIFIRRVAGKSMLPTLRPGRIVLVTGIYRRLRKDDVVVIYHQGLEKVKRIQAIRQGRLYVTGDNRYYSTDSASFGWLDIHLVQGKVIWPRI